MPSNWDRVIGQTRAKRTLRTALQSGRLAHAYLFWGHPGIGKDALAIEFARVLLCPNGTDEACGSCPSCRKMDALHHPNMKMIFPLPGGDAPKKQEREEGDDSIDTEVFDEIKRQTTEKAANPYLRIEIPKAKFIRIASIREIKRQSSMSGAEAGRKVFLILDADAMNDESANSLLKVLEEPLEGVFFLLVSSRKETLKQTIVSRCQPVHCAPLTEEEIGRALSERWGVPSAQSKNLARLSNGSVTRALELNDGEIDRFRNDVIAFLRSILGPSPIKLFQEQEDYLSGNRRDQAEQLLSMMLIWFRDTIMLREGAPHHLFNSDQESDLTRFVDRFRTKDLESCLTTVERSLELLRRNVYLPLVMLSLTVQLRRILHAQ